jgi:hypothetical protein
MVTTVYVRELVGSADTAEQGQILWGIIAPLLERGETVRVSFDGVGTTTSSFVNTAFAPLLKIVSFDTIKERLRITEASRQIIDLIRRRMAMKTNEHAHA